MSNLYLEKPALAGWFFRPNWTLFRMVVISNLGMAVLVLESGERLRLRRETGLLSRSKPLNLAVLRLEF